MPYGSTVAGDGWLEAGGLNAPAAEQVTRASKNHEIFRLSRNTVRSFRLPRTTPWIPADSKSSAPSCKTQGRRDDGCRRSQSELVGRKFVAGAKVPMGIAGGKNWDEGKPPPLQAARRELMKRTGYRANKWKKLVYSIPAQYVAEKMTIFPATV